jgi:hypothetical protein
MALNSALRPLNITAAFGNLGKFDGRPELGRIADRADERLQRTECRRRWCLMQNQRAVGDAESVLMSKRIRIDGNHATPIWGNARNGQSYSGHVRQH